MFYVDVNRNEQDNEYYNIDKKLYYGIEKYMARLIAEEYKMKDTFDMSGIKTTVNTCIANKVLERAIYYCPKKTGYLASTGRIENLSDGSSIIYFDCDYAWYVHERTWVNHPFPTCAKFLTLAVQEVKTFYGL